MLEINNNRPVNVCVSQLPINGEPLPSGHTMAILSPLQIEAMFNLSGSTEKGVILSTEWGGEEAEEKYSRTYLAKFGSTGNIPRITFTAINMFFESNKISDQDTLIILFRYANGFTFYWNEDLDPDTDVPTRGIPSALLAKVEIFFEHVAQS